MADESPLSAEHHIARQFYDAAHHGPLWTLVYEMLHLIVLIYSLFGMIHFEVKFISIHRLAKRLVKAVSYLMVAHSWYMCLKFSMIFVALYLFMYHLEYYAIAMDQFNCTLADRGPVNLLIQRQWDSIDRARRVNRVFRRFKGYKIVKWGHLIFEPGWLKGLVPVVHWLAGPYIWLGYRAVLVFGFYSVAHLILLAVFPLELYVENHSFNQIRFVLNDTNCLRELYQRRARYLAIANAYVGLQALVNHFDLNRHISFQAQHIPKAAKASLRLWLDLAGSIGDPRSSKMWPQPPANLLRLTVQQLLANDANGSSSSSSSSSSPLAPFKDQRWPTGSPASRGKEFASVTQHQHQQWNIIANDWRRRYENIMVANSNMDKFVPHVRSESWFKLSMILYPIFIYYYFASLLAILGSISWQIITQVFVIDEACYSLFQIHLCHPMDLLIFWELLYAVPCLSIASSFYCSYYFTTMLELYVWLLELCQQLDVCILSASKLHSNNIHQHLGCSELNEFGGLTRIWHHLWSHLVGSSGRHSLRNEAWAVRLLSKRETLFRATYVNINLFLDEFRATRHLTEKILTRTTQLAIAFAFLVSITHLSFERSVLRMAMLLGAAQLILNLYLWSAAMVNTMANRTIKKLQYLDTVCRSQGRPDLASMFARYAGQDGFEEDDFAYTLFNQRITWTNIFEFNGKVTSAYMFTLK